VTPHCFIDRFYLGYTTVRQVYQTALMCWHS